MSQQGNTKHAVTAHEYASNLRCDESLARLHLAACSGDLPFRPASGTHDGCASCRFRYFRLFASGDLASLSPIVRSTNSTIRRLAGARPGVVNLGSSPGILDRRDPTRDPAGLPDVPHFSQGDPKFP